MLVTFIKENIRLISPLLQENIRLISPLLQENIRLISPLLQEDFLLMEQKWLAEQKRKKYFEEQAAIEEKKTREISQQLYMIMTNELTPASFKVILPPKK